MPKQPINIYMDDVRPCPLIGYKTVRTVEVAQRYLANGCVAHLSLDHDMCPQSTIGMQPAKPTGYDLVVWMARTGHWPQHKPGVHSANPEGAKRMRLLIEREWPVRDIEWEPRPAECDHLQHSMQEATRSDGWTALVWCEAGQWHWQVFKPGKRGALAYGDGTDELDARHRALLVWPRRMVS